MSKAGRNSVLVVGLVALTLLQPAPGQSMAARSMSGGKLWTTQNVNVVTPLSWCYQDLESNCARYGRLYTWEAAQQVCRALGSGWRLPTDQEWRQMARGHGGVSEDSPDRGKAAYKALYSGGTAGFGALLGGGRDEAGEYGRLDAHGFYWTASAQNAGNAWFYNFAKGGLALHRQGEGEKGRAFSVRCVR